MRLREELRRVAARRVTARRDDEDGEREGIESDSAHRVPKAWVLRVAWGREIFPGAWRCAIIAKSGRRRNSTIGYLNGTPRCTSRVASR